MQDENEFNGAKLILFIGEQLLVIRRDFAKGIPWPGYLDWPGGGREGNETAQMCALREAWEEVGLQVTPEALLWGAWQMRAGAKVWFFAARLPAASAKDIIFGNEGLGWCLVDPEEFLVRADAIPHFRDQLAAFLAWMSANGGSGGVRV